MGSQMGPQIWPLGHGPGAIFGGPRPETPDFHVQNGQNPGSGPWAQDPAPGGPIPLYIGEIALFGPWAPGPGALFLYVHSGEIEKRPTFTRWLLFS